MRRFSLMLAVVVAASLLVAPGTVSAGEDDPAIKLRLLLQGQAQVTEDGTPAKDGWGTDFFLRRARIILAGNVNKWIHFFAETDTPNFGKVDPKTGKWTEGFFLQDAFVDFQMYKELKVACGMLLLPFTHHSRQSAATLNTLDYHNLFSGKFVSDKVWRDMGIEARGLVADMLDYRVGIYSGLNGLVETGKPTLNPDDMPRFTGRLALNLMDPEPDYFYGGTYLGKKKIVTVGTGFDVQPGAALNDKAETKMYMAFSGDLFVDYPLNEQMELTAQAAFVYYDRGQVQLFDKDGKLTGMAAHDGTGMGSYGDVGFRYGMFQPTIGAEWFDADREGKEMVNLRGGINMWIQGHAANLKLEYAYVDIGEADLSDGFSQVTLQTQLLF